MTVNFSTALDEIYTVFKDGIENYASTDFDFVIFWDDEEALTHKSLSTVYFRVKHFIVRQYQDTFATDVTERQFTTIGLLTVSVYVPRVLENGQDVARSLGNYIRSLYVESTSSGVWFRDQQVITTTKQYDENYYQTAVSVTYEYNELLS